ncbi:fatty acid synthase-like [Haemaphysalis longicornis]
MNADDLVISGFSAIFPDADCLSEFQKKLYAGVDMVTGDGLRWPPGLLGLPDRMGKIRDLSRFDAQFFGVHTRQAHTLDPQQRLLMERAYEAIFDAGYDPSEFRGQKVGVFVGACVSESGQICSCDTNKMAAFGQLGSSMGMLSNRISYAMDFIGPSVTVRYGLLIDDGRL